MTLFVAARETQAGRPTFSALAPPFRGGIGPAARKRCLRMTKTMPAKADRSRLIDRRRIDARIAGLEAGCPFASFHLPAHTLNDET